MVRNEQNPETIVSSSMRIEGELKSAGNIRIDGIIKGRVQTMQDLMIGPNAQIDADLTASNALIAGVIKGNLTIKGSLVLLETAKIMGNISCNSLGVKEGAYFSGNCRMNGAKQPQVEPQT